MDEIESDLLHYLVVLFSCLLLISFLMVRYYASRRTSMAIQLLATISFAAGFSGTLLLPIDLSLNIHHANHSSGNGNDNGNVNADDAANANADGAADNNNYYNDDDGDGDGADGEIGYYEGTLVPWHILFWSTSTLAWVILPIVKEMLLSGNFTLYQQFREGVRKRLRLVFIVLFIAIVAIIWLAIYLHSFNVLPVIITLANTYGLLLVSLLLGYGLIALPRKIWNQATPEYELRKTQIMAVSADEALFEAVWELQDVEYAIDATISRIVDLKQDDRMDMFYKDCVHDLVSRKNETAELKPELHLRRTPLDQRRLDCEYTYDDEYDSSSPRSVSGSNDDLEAGNNSGSTNGNNNRRKKNKHSKLNVDDKPPMEELIALNRRLKRAQEILYNTDRRWESIVIRHDYFQRIIHTWTGKWIWIRCCRTIFFRFIAVLAMWLSALTLWSEATLGLPYNLTPFAMVQEALSQKDIENDIDGNDGGDDGISTSTAREDLLFQLAASVPLLYMSICVATSIFKLTMFGPFALRGYRQSHGVALILNSQFLARLIFPLGYNYLLMLKYDTSSCAFSTFLGQMEVVPLFGTTFSVYAPLLIIALCVFTLFNIYPRLMNLLGIDHEDAILLGDEETMNAKVNEGMLLLRRNRNDSDLSCEMPMVKRSKSDDEGII